MKKQLRFRPPVIGGSSLIIIFAVLCLTMFTLLALSTAKAGSRLSNSSIQAVSDYYEADRQAEIIFSNLRDPSHPLPQGVQQIDNIYSYSIPISTSGTQYLLVEIQNEHDTWTVLRWQAVSMTDS